jgi:hypothetical protein
MSSNSWRENISRQRKGQAGDLAGTTAQDLWNGCHALFRLSERQNVQGGAVAPLSLQQPLAFRRRSMNKAYFNYYPTSCENDSPFRQGLLWPKIRYYPSLPFSIGQSIPWPLPISASFRSSGPAIRLTHTPSSRKKLLRQV